MRLSIVSDEGEAEVVCGLLRAEGIRCFHRVTDLSAPMRGASLIEWREILVLASELPRARELIDSIEPIVEECTRCGHAIGEEGGWYREESGELNPYCGVCAGRLFGS